MSLKENKCLKTIELSGAKGAGQYARVDDEDYERLRKRSWQLHSAGYAVRFDFKRNGRSHMKLMHRDIMQAKKGQQVDHANGNRLDNRRKNLRLCKTFQNRQNAIRHSDNRSGFKGVSRCGKEGDRYRTRIQLKGRSTEIVSFGTSHQAAMAYDLWAVDLFGDFAKTNFQVVVFGP